MHIRIGVLSKLVDVRLPGIVDGEANLRGRPRSIPARRIGQRDGEFVAGREPAGHDLARGQRDGDLCGALRIAKRAARGEPGVMFVLLCAVG